MYHCISEIIQYKEGNKMNFEFDNNIPIYIQLVENIKLEIISGKLKPGDKLPFFLLINIPFILKVKVN